MRLLVINAIAIGGGVTTSFLSALQMIVNEGHEAIAMVPEKFQFREKVESIATETIYVSGLEKGGHLALPAQIMRISSAVRKNNIDRIIVNNGRLIHGLKLAQKCPVVCIYHGGKIDRILNADRILTINDVQYEWLEQRGFPSDDLTVVDNVLPIDALPKWQPRSFDEPLTIGTLRLLEPAKGVDTLIDALGILAAKGKKYRVLIGSDGTQREKLEASAKRQGLSDSVTFTGWVESSADFYKRLDMYILPSRFEEWGLGVAEAWSYSLPVIATDCLGPQRLVQSGENGLLVARDNPQAMAKGIEELASSPELAQKLATQGYKSAGLYLMKNIQKDYVSFVTGAISKFEK